MSPSNSDKFWRKIFHLDIIVGFSSPGAVAEDYSARNSRLDLQHKVECKKKQTSSTRGKELHVDDQVLVAAGRKGRVVIAG